MKAARIAWSLVVLAFVLGVGGYLVGCEDEHDLRSTDGPPVIPPPSGYSHPSGDAGVPAAVPRCESCAIQNIEQAIAAGLKPTVPEVRWYTPPDKRATEPAPGVTLVQQRLDINPAMGPCPDWGAAAGQAWTQIFYYAAPNAASYPNGQPNNCKQLPPNSHYTDLSPSWIVYPSTAPINNNIRAFFAYANPGSCVRVYMRENVAGQSGPELVYTECATVQSGVKYVWSPDVQAAAGLNLGVTQAAVEWWYQ